MAEQLSRIRRAVRSGLRRARALAGGGGNDPVILMYHRIATPPFDPWGLCVSAENFADQLHALCARGPVLALDDLVGRLEAGTVPPRTVAITFDDGYADNVETAIPLLRAAGIPATIFVTTGQVDRTSPFWWDELALLVLGSSLARDCRVSMGDREVHLNWPTGVSGTSAMSQWRVGRPARDPRQVAYERLWRILQAMAPSDRQVAMDRLRAELGEDHRGDATARGASGEQLRGAVSDLLTLGGHGRSHAPLPQLPPEACEAEITGAAKDLEELTGARPTGFAYPHGEFDLATRSLVAATGYRWAVSTRPLAIDRKAFDLFALPRIAAANETGAELIGRMRRVFAR